MVKCQANPVQFYGSKTFEHLDLVSETSANCVISTFQIVRNTPL